MGKKEKNKEKLISSIDLLNRTGLSRATLNNYIKAGILPHPIVKKPNNETLSKAKRMGYFPDHVLDTLNQIIQYKKEGRSMEEICKSVIRKSADSPRHDQRKGTVTTSVGVSPSGLRNESGELFYLEENRLSYVPKEKPTKRDEISQSAKESEIHDLFKSHMPIPLTFSILAADLQDSVKICDEMLPEEYLKLINQIWICLESSLKKYVGIYGRHPGNGVVYYFLKDNNSNYLMSPVYCALELREKMKDLNDKWKRDKGWSEDLYLNVGINEGYEFFGKISAAPTIEFITLGNTANNALRLSDFARCGSIWTTKNLMTRLEEKERKKIRYGIHRSQPISDVLIDNTFSRIADLIPHDRENVFKFSDISNTTVTEIHNLR